MKKKLKKLWNNRIFRTFLQNFISTIVVYFSATTMLDINANMIVGLIVSAIATGLAAIMPFFNEKEEC